MHDMNTVIAYLQRQRDTPSTQPQSAPRQGQGDHVLQRLRDQDPVVGEMGQQQVDVNMIRAIGKQLYQHNASPPTSSVHDAAQYASSYPQHYQLQHQYQSDDYDSSSPYTSNRTVSTDSDRDSDRQQAVSYSHFPPYSSMSPPTMDMSYGHHDTTSATAVVARGGQKRHAAASTSSSSDGDWTPKKCKTDASALRASDMRCENQVVIDVGYIIPDSGQRIYYVNVAAWFDHPVEVYTAVSDVRHKMLFRASVLADKFGCATNTISMFLQRLKQRNRLLAACGLYQATGFTRKPRGRIGLKAGGYFITMEVCQHFQSYWMKQLAKNGHRKSMSAPASQPANDETVATDRSMKKQDTAASTASGDQLYSHDNTVDVTVQWQQQEPQQQSTYQPRQASLHFAPDTTYSTAPSAPVYSDLYGSSEVDEVDPLAGVGYSNTAAAPPSLPFDAQYVQEQDSMKHGQKAAGPPCAVANHKLLATQLQYSAVGVFNSDRVESAVASTPTVVVPNEYQRAEAVAQVESEATPFNDAFALPSRRPSANVYGTDDWLSVGDIQERGLSLRLPSIPITPLPYNVNPFKTGSAYDGYQWDDVLETRDQITHLAAMR